MRKRIISMLLVAVMLISLLPATALAATTEVASGECGENLTWTLDSEGTLTISGTGDMTDYSYWYNHKTDAPWNVFYDDIKELLIEDGVTTVGSCTFTHCRMLEKVSIPDSIISIGSCAFEKCSNLSKITLPPNVESIGAYAFQDCLGLTEITIPDSVTNIGSWAFSFCTNLNRVVLPKNLTHIENSTFWGTNITTINLPNNVVSIGECAFADCFNLESIKLSDNLVEIGEFAFQSCKLQNITLPKNLSIIGSAAFTGCTALRKLYFTGNVPEMHESIFSGVMSNVYYPVNNATWTADVMHDYGGTITWIPYNPETDDSEPPACALSELTELDYLAFAQIAYLDYQSDCTVKQALTNMGYWNRMWSKDQNITYGELCEHIANWTIDRSLILDLSSFNGFYAVPFTNSNGEVVLAYRGSETPMNVLTDWDAYCDWIKNDLPIELANNLGPQHQSARVIYNAVAKKYGISNMVVTGHSLGGAWADVISAYSGCKGVTFNAVSVLDTAYCAKPVDMGRNFSGVDKWQFVDHTNQYDLLAGMFESYWSLNRIKPYKAHDSLYSEANLAGNHGLQSIVKKKGTIKLTPAGYYDSYSPFDVVTNHLSFSMSSIDLGTSRDDTINEASNSVWARTSFGGDGDDSITGGILGDTLVGGRGYDSLDGGWSNDTYVYYKGDDWDYIYDLSGKDELYLYNFEDSDIITAELSDGNDTIDIKCNGSRIVSIYRNNREYTFASLNMFVIHKGNKETDITSMFKTVKYQSRIKVACPVNIEVLDAEGNVVFTLEDGAVGNHYTDYGNFYVYEEEDGGYGKVMDLVEGYSVRVVGVDDGTMEIEYHRVEDGELSAAETITGIPVTPDFVADVEENETGNMKIITNLIGELNFDGKVDVDDVLALLWNVLFPDEYPIEAEADFDGNGETDVDDVLTLLWHVLFPDDYPLN